MRFQLGVDGDPVLVDVEEPRFAVARIEALVARTTSRGAAAGPAASSGGRDRVVGDLERQPVAHRGLGVEAHTEQQRGPRGLHADGALQHPRRAAARMDTEFLKPRVEKRRRPRNQES